MRLTWPGWGLVVYLVGRRTREDGSWLGTWDGSLGGKRREWKGREGKGRRVVAVEEGKERSGGEAETARAPPPPPRDWGRVAVACIFSACFRCWLRPAGTRN